MKRTINRLISTVLVLVFLGILLMVFHSTELFNTLYFTQDYFNEKDMQIFGTNSDIQCISKIDNEKLEILSNADAYTFWGKDFFSEKGSDIDLSKQFEIMHESDTLCHQNPVEMTIHFTADIPSEIMWSQYYYRETSAKSIDEIPEKFISIDNVSDDITLQLGHNNITYYSTIQTEAVYKVIHLICKYENKEMEYYIIFDGWRVE